MARAVCEPSALTGPPLDYQCGMSPLAPARSYLIHRTGKASSPNSSSRTSGRARMCRSVLPRSLWPRAAMPLMSSGRRCCFLPRGRTRTPICLLFLHGRTVNVVPLIPVLHLLIELLDDHESVSWPFRRYTPLLPKPVFLLSLQISARCITTRCRLTTMGSATWCAATLSCTRTALVATCISARKC